MPIIVKAKKNESFNDLFKRFKKKVIVSDIVQKVKDRRYHQKPSRLKATKTAERSRLKKRLHSLKKTKNISPIAIGKIVERMSHL